MKYLLTGEETERLKFRLLDQSDFEAWQPLFDEPRVAEFLDMKPGSPKQHTIKLGLIKYFIVTKMTWEA